MKLLFLAALICAAILYHLAAQGEDALNRCLEVTTLETCIKQGVSN